MEGHDPSMGKSSAPARTSGNLMRPELDRLLAKPTKSPSWDKQGQEGRVELGTGPGVEVSQHLGIAPCGPWRPRPGAPGVPITAHVARGEEEAPPSKATNRCSDAERSFIRRASR